MQTITPSHVYLPDGTEVRVRVSLSLPEEADALRNAARLVLLPGFVDLHTHLRDPGLTYKEDILSGCAAACAGGYAAVVAMPNTKPVTDSPEVLDYIADKAKGAACAVFPCAAITRGQAGRELVDFDTLAAHGAAAFSDDGKPVEDPALMLAAMKHAAAHGYLIISHPEEPRLSKGGSVNAGAVAEKLGLPGIDPLAEEAAIARDLLLCEATGCRLHLAHVSTKRGVELIRQAKARGLKATAETCPHYFTFTEDELLNTGANAKMNPPLRTRADVEGIIEGLADGTIDCISTDHAPHSREEKALPLDRCPSGIIGVQTAFASGVTELVRPGRLTLAKLVELMSDNPRRILGGDIPKRPVLAELDTPFVLRESDLKGKSANTPLLGRTLYGRIFSSPVEVL